MVYQLSLTAQNGRIWTKRPTPRADGLLSSFSSAPLAQQYGVAQVAFTAVTFDASGDTLAACDDRGHVFLFLITQNRYLLLSKLSHDVLPGVVIALSPLRRNEVLVASARGQLYRMWKGLGGTQVAALCGHSNAVISIAFHPRAWLCLTTSRDTVVLWHTRDWTRRQSLRGQANNPFADACFAPVGNLVLTCGGSSSVRRAVVAWDCSSMQFRGELQVPDADATGRALTAPLACFAVTPNGHFVLAGGADRTLFLFDTRLWLLVRAVELPIAAHRVVSIQFQTGFPYAAVLASDGLLRFVSVPDLVLKWSIPSATASARVVSAFALNRRGRYMACVSDASNLCIYDMLQHEEWRSKQDTAPEETLCVRPFRRVAAVKHRPRSTWEAPSKASAQCATTASSEAAAAAVPHRVLAGADADVLQHDKLLRMLDVYGRFPDKYRMLIWRHVLQLPDNQEAFAALRARGLHPVYADLAARPGMARQRLASTFQRQLSALAHWSPVFAAERTFVPEFVFPFVQVVGYDAISCFETLATFFLNHGGAWFQYFPHPPISLLNQVDLLLQHHAKDLLVHLRRVKVSAEVYVWGMLRNAFSELFDRPQWLALWDNILSRPPRWLTCLLVALLRAFAPALMRMSTLHEFQVWLVRRGAAPDVLKLVALTAEIQRTTPSHLMAKLDSAPFTPMPQGLVYPVMNAYARLYPKYEVQHQLEHVKRIAAEEREWHEKRALTQDLRSKIQSLQVESQQHEQQLKTLEQLESDRRARLDTEAEERVRMRERTLVQLRRQRLKYVNTVEGNMAKFLDTQRAMREREVERLDTALEAQRRERAAMLKAMEEEAALLELENQAAQRERELDLRRDREATLATMRAQVDAARTRAAMQDEVVEQTWQTEDAERRKRLQLEKQARERRALLEEDTREQHRVADEVARMELQRQVELARAEHARRLLALDDEAAAAAEEQREDVQRGQQVFQREHEREQRALLQLERARRVQNAQQRKRVIERALAQRRLESELHTERLRELERVQTLRDFDETVAQRQIDVAAEEAEEDARVKQVLAALEEQGITAGDVDSELDRLDAEFKHKVEHARRLGDSLARDPATERSVAETAAPRQREPDIEPVVQQLVQEHAQEVKQRTQHLRQAMQAAEERLGAAVDQARARPAERVSIRTVPDDEVDSPSGSDAV